MPLGYGGGIKNIDQIKALYQAGFEKISINTAACENPELITQGAKAFGSQSIVVSIDVKKHLMGDYEVLIRGGKKRTGRRPAEYAQEMERRGAGEILVTSIDRDGSMEGYDLRLIKMVSSVVGIPVVACGGAGKIDDFRKAIQDAGASAVAAGAMFVFQGRHRAVLINFPDSKELERALCVR
jgi:cyclase